VTCPTDGTSYQVSKFIKLSPAAQGCWSVVEAGCAGPGAVIERQHQVTISQSYYMGVYEVTQAQYQKVMGENPSYFQGDAVAIKIPAKKHPQTGRTIEEEKIVPVDTSKSSSLS
jgi:esterase/lipase superfamily enzyme